MRARPRGLSLEALLTPRPGLARRVAQCRLKHLAARGGSGSLVPDEPPVTLPPIRPMCRYRASRRIIRKRSRGLLIAAIFSLISKSRLRDASRWGISTIFCRFISRVRLGTFENRYGAGCAPSVTPVKRCGRPSQTDASF